MQSEGETGLIYAQQRYYSPKLGRFLSRDPLGFSGGLHPYAYCDNDPHNRTDPDGLDWIPKGLGDLIGWTGRGIGQALKGLDDAVGSLAGAAVDAVNAATRPTMVSGTPTLGNAQYGGGKEGAPQRKAMHRAGRALNDAIDGVEKGIAKEALYQAMGGALHAAGTLAEQARIARAARFGCFVAGTPVQMADGSEKPIEQVKLGERVFSRDETTGETVSAVVERTTVRERIPTLMVLFANGQRIVTTSEHPFFVVGRGFVAAGELKTGDGVATRAGTVVLVRSCSLTGKRERVYNFTVSKTHTYFVGTTFGGVWVHNIDCADIAGAISKGHAFEKHILFKNEFAGLGVRTRKQFAEFIENIISHASGTNVKNLSRGRVAYWDASSGTVVIYNPNARDLGTIFRPDAGRGYFDALR